MTVWSIVRALLALAIAFGSAVWLSALGCAFRFRARRAPAAWTQWPPVTLLKPVYGLERNLHENLRTACLQDYPRYQVVFSVQRPDDPAIPVLRRLEAEFGRERACVAIETIDVGLNGKINNLCGALRHARHDVLVVSDSDVQLRPDFLRAIVAPLADPSVGIATSFFQGAGAQHWYEKLELLSLNADQFAMAMLASATRMVEFCFGVSMAFTRATLERCGGFAAFAHTLVEDTEMGRAVRRSGQRLVAIPHVVTTSIDLASPRAWVQKQVYWEQNTLAAVPGLFAASWCLRVIPLSLAFAALRGWDATGLAVLGAATSVRLLSAAAVLGVALRDGEGLRALWLLPLKDVFAVVAALRALASRSVTWRGVELSVAGGGRLAAPTRARAAVEHGQ